MPRERGTGVSRRERLLRAAVVLAVTLGPPAAAAAQETREAEIARLQAEKAADLRAPGATRAERIVQRLLGPRGPVFGWVGDIYSGGRVAAGAGTQLPLGDTGQVTARAGISIRNYHLIEGGVRLPDLVPDRLVVSAYARWIDARRVPFYEPGGDVEDARRTRFVFAPATIGVESAVHLTGWLSAGLAAERLDASVRWLNPEDRLARAASGDDTTYGVLRASLQADSRESPGYSTRGGLYRVEWATFADGAAGGPASFRQTEVEAVQLIPIARANWIVALRGLATTTATDAGGEVPFFMLPSLGGGSTLRGYHSWRFRDRHRLLLSGEYRWTPGQLVEMAVFVDAGKVAARRSDLDLSGLRKNVGIGIRFHGPDVTPLRFELARGDEGWKLNIGGGTAF